MEGDKIQEREFFQLSRHPFTLILFKCIIFRFEAKDYLIGSALSQLLLLLFKFFGRVLNFRKFTSDIIYDRFVFIAFRVWELKVTFCNHI